MRTLQENFKNLAIVIMAFVFAIVFTACSGKDDGSSIRQTGNPENTKPDGSNSGDTTPNGDSTSSDSPSDDKALPSPPKSNSSMSQQILSADGAVGIGSDDVSTQAPNELDIETQEEVIGTRPVTSEDRVLFSPDGGVTTQAPMNADYPEGTKLVTVDEDYVHVGPGEKSYDPITTRRVTPQGFDYTDFKDDLAMARILMLASQQEQELGSAQFYEDSIEFANRIKDIYSDVRIETDRGVDLVVKIQDGGQIYRVAFKGELNSNNHAVLTQESNSIGDGAYTFRAYLTCIDVNMSRCESSIVVIEQVQNGQVCKRAFAVTRWVNGLLMISDEDYVKYPSYSNENQVDFLEYLHNSILFNRIKIGKLAPAQGDTALVRLPFMRAMGIRSFAVAFGASYFQIEGKESFYNSFNKNHIDGSVIDKTVDQLRISGPLLKQEKLDNAAYALQFSGEVRNASDQVLSNESAYANKFTSVYLVGNDGRGKIELEFNFVGGGKTYVEFWERGFDTVDPMGMRFYPLQDVTAPIQAK